MAQHFNPKISLKDYIDSVKKNLKTEISSIKGLWQDEKFLISDIKWIFRTKLTPQKH